ncbi:DgyrCDS9623 [Dimorphilus gyrociliatus]|uniref:DgyrCDS9623 n=1 Tax=Dimorphilus gyrociliatus TaxID=2664684 RepID=A0A7I8VXJ4_9ANNE|nr:DgyrCDS9623 [Dimorphilus gyrociliatus]
MSRKLSILLLNTAFKRHICTTNILFSGFNKGKKPFDPRFPISTKDASRFKEGGSEYMEQQLGDTENTPQLQGYIDENGKFVHVPEMVPEFVVPDLTNFKLKPYVSYKVEDVKQSELTEEKLFIATMGRDIVNNVKSGKMTIEDVEKLLEKQKEEFDKSKDTIL